MVRILNKLEEKKQKGAEISNDNTNMQSPTLCIHFSN